MTITLNIFSPTIEPQLFMLFRNIIPNQFEQTQPSSNTAQNFQSSKILILPIEYFFSNTGKYGAIVEVWN